MGHSRARVSSRLRPKGPRDCPEKRMGIGASEAGVPNESEARISYSLCFMLLA
jgi:hypothetical protein